MTETTTLYCYVHPARETTLRCRRCERPICTSCAVRMPTGYICKECARAHQKVFETAVWYDYLIVLAASAVLSAIAAVLTIMISPFFWGLAVIFLAPLAGGVIGNMVRRLVRNRRSRALNLTLGTGMVLGALPVLMVSGLPGLWFMFAGGVDLITLAYSFAPVLWQIVYLALAIPSAYSQFSGIVFRK